MPLTVKKKAGEKIASLEKQIKFIGGCFDWLAALKSCHIQVEVFKCFVPD